MAIKGRTTHEKCDHQDPQVSLDLRVALDDASVVVADTNKAVTAANCPK